MKGKVQNKEMWKAFLRKVEKNENEKYLLNTAKSHEISDYAELGPKIEELENLLLEKQGQIIVDVSKVGFRIVVGKSIIPGPYGSQYAIFL